MERLGFTMQLNQPAGGGKRSAVRFYPVSPGVWTLGDSTPETICRAALSARREGKE